MRVSSVVALCCLILGILLLIAGGVLNARNPMVLLENENCTFSTSQLPQQIDISTVYSNIEIRPVEGDEWRVESVNRKDLYHKVELVDGILIIQQIDERFRYGDFAIIPDENHLSLILYLPAEICCSVNIRSTVGQIVVFDGISFSDVSLETDRAPITFTAHTTGSLHIKTNAGKVDVKGSVDGELHINSTSGDISIQNITPEYIGIESYSGNIYMKDVICRNRCSVSGTSIDVRMERCDADSFGVSVTSGNINVSVLTPKSCHCISPNGKVSASADDNSVIAGSVGSGAFFAITHNGDINIRLSEP